MNRSKMIRKIWNLAQYDMFNNFYSWFLVTGFYATVCTIIFFVITTFVDNTQVSYWNWFPNIILDWIVCFDALLQGNAGIVGYALLGTLLIAIPMMLLVLIKNALDLAFDSAMSGFVIRDLPYTTLAYYEILFFIGHAIIVGLVGSAMVGVVYFLPAESEVSLLLFHGFTYIFLACAMYLWFLLLIACMHVIEYRKGIIESLHEVRTMLHGSYLLILQVLIIQSIVVLCVAGFMYNFFYVVAKIPISIIIWFFEMLHLPLQTIIVSLIVLYNYFTLWAYFLLSAWVYLIFAHVYRQLICPPTNNSGCISCTSCK